MSGLEAAGLAAHEGAIRSLARLEPADAGFAPTATLAVAGGVEVALDLSGTIDVAAETARLNRDLAAARKEKAQAAAKLGNADFLAKAPEAVVAKMRARAAAADADIARLTAQLAALSPVP
jgi:valyl-tRNA synthetase